MMMSTALHVDDVYGMLLQWDRAVRRTGGLMMMSMDVIEPGGPPDRWSDFDDGDDGLQET